MATARVYVDGWNFYHSIDKKDIHPLGFCDLKKLSERVLGSTASIDAVHYFSATGRNGLRSERQDFWLRALESVGIRVAELGYFDKAGGQEKTTDVRLALQLVEDARIYKHQIVLLISADADFTPALEIAIRHGKQVRVALPLERSCEKLERIDRLFHRISKGDLEASLFDGEGVTDKGDPLTKALEFGWACRVGGQVRFGSQAGESEHWESSKLKGRRSRRHY